MTTAVPNAGSSAAPLMTIDVATDLLPSRPDRLVDIVHLGSDAYRASDAAGHGALVGVETEHPFDFVTILFTDTFEPVADMDPADD